MEQAQGKREVAAEWYAAAAEHERWLAALARWQRWIFLTGYCLLVIPFAFSNPKIFLFVFLGVVGFPLMGYIWRRIRHAPLDPQLPAHQLKQLEQLRHSDLAQRLASGELTGSEPAEYVPRALRWLVPPLANTQRALLLRRVHMWWEWYMGPPRQQLSPYWTMLAAFSAMPLMLIALNATSGGLVQNAVALAIFLMFAGMTAWKYEDEGGVLIRYLRSAWQPAVASDSTSLAEGTQAIAPSQLKLTRQSLLIINQAEQDLGDSMHGFSAMPMLLLMFGLMPVLMDTKYGSWMFLLIFLVPSLSMLEGSRLWIKEREKDRAQLNASALAARLAASELSEARLAEHVPAFLNFFLTFPSPPKAYANELRQQIFRAALNLDWYLGPPRRLIRAHWLAILVQLLVMLGVIFYRSVEAYSGTVGLAEPPLNWIEICYIAAVVGLTVPTIIFSVRFTIWREELISYLRRCATGGLPLQDYPVAADGGVGSAGGSAGKSST